MDIDRLVKFLTLLKSNNNKIWFQENRVEYIEIKNAFLKLIEEIIFYSVEFDVLFKNLSPSKVLYRLNRDLRFSRNKLPYKDEFGALFALRKKESENGYHFHINSSGELFIGAGIYRASKVLLNKIKDKIIEDPETFENIIYNREFNDVFGGLSQEFRYKKIPQEYAKFYDLVEILSLKSFFVFKGFKLSEYKNDPARFISNKFKEVSPLVKYLKEIDKST